jgi:tRNA G37 N-methylase TrmD
MPRFKLAIVKRGKEALWRDYWVNSSSEGSADDAPSGLGRTEVVEAKCVDEAIEAVQREHPDCTVMLAGGEHHSD